MLSPVPSMRSMIFQHGKRYWTECGIFALLSNNVSPTPQCVIDGPCCGNNRLFKRYAAVYWRLSVAVKSISSMLTLRHYAVWQDCKLQENVVCRLCMKFERSGKMRPIQTSKVVGHYANDSPVN